MIISASFRTDIPAFYGKWFQHRLDAGYCVVTNPYDGKPFRVSLLLKDVDGIFFWTKNVGPFLPTLKTLRERGYAFVVDYSITGYPRVLERAVVDWKKAVQHLRFISQEYGPRVPVWRYDPIVVTSLTDVGFHLSNFNNIARRLSGVVDEVVVSFMEIFKKTRRKLDSISALSGFTWTDPPDGAKHKLLTDLSQIAANYGMTLRLCAQPQYLCPGVEEASCIDVGRLSDVSGRRIAGKKPGHRGKKCGCYMSRDIGAYETCPHGCVYCYAVNDVKKAREFYREHDRCGDTLNPLGHGDVFTGNKQPCLSPCYH